MEIYYGLPAREKEIRINLPEEVWRNIDTIIIRLFQEELVQEELVVEKQKEIEREEGEVIA